MKAFTLVEVLVTITLIGILTVVFFNSNLFSFKDTKTQFIENDFLDLKYLHQSKQLVKEASDPEFLNLITKDQKKIYTSKDTNLGTFNCNDGSGASLSQVDLLFFCDEDFSSFLFDRTTKKFVNKDLHFKQKVGEFNSCELNGEPTYGYIKFTNSDLQLFINAQTCTIDLSRA